MGLATAIPVYLEDSELIRLTAVIMKDVNQDIPADLRINFPDGAAGYYDIPLAWFQDIQEKADFVTLYLHCPPEV